MTMEPVRTANEKPNRLTLDDIADQRAYERERPAFRARMLEVRKRRRLTLGPVVAVSFESRDTIRYQIQEMARAEKLSTDEDIQIELDTYNPLVPGPDQLCATVFLELTDEDQMRQWLPKLVGIEHSIVIRLADGTRIRSTPEAQHATQLTRENATSAVHYVQFELTPAERAVLIAGPSVVGIDHPDYRYEVTLADETALELAAGG